MDFGAGGSRGIGLWQSVWVLVLLDSVPGQTPPTKKKSWSKMAENGQNGF